MLEGEEFMLESPFGKNKQTKKTLVYLAREFFRSSYFVAIQTGEIQEHF